MRPAPIQPIPQQIPRGFQCKSTCMCPSKFKCIINNFCRYYKHAILKLLYKFIDYFTKSLINTYVLGSFDYNVY